MQAATLELVLGRLDIVLVLIEVDVSRVTAYCIADGEVFACLYNLVFAVLQEVGT